MWDADQMAVTCKRNGQGFVAHRVGRNLLLDVQKGDVVELTFPVPARTDKYTIHGKVYEIHYRGSTVVDINNRNTNPAMIPLYQRQAMKATKTPVHTVKRFVADNILPLTVQ
jgi:hypothetical protein